jgi:hypothetical protein
MSVKTSNSDTVVSKFQTCKVGGLLHLTPLSTIFQLSWRSVLLVEKT